MRIKRIKENCDKVIKDFAESIEDAKVKELVLKNTIITGGAIASMLQDEEVKDYDIYFRNKETVIAVAEYFLKGSGFQAYHKESPLIQSILGLDSESIIQNFKDGLKKYDEQSLSELYEQEEKLHEFDINIRHLSILTNKFYQDEEDRVIIYNHKSGSQMKKIEQTKETKKQKYRVQHISSNAITLSDKIQLVIRFYGEPADIHTNYDFIHTTNYWTSWDEKVVTNTAALESILTKTLIYAGSKYPVCSVIRTRKFIKRGYHVDAGQYIKMIFQINEMNLNDYFVLEEQLIGVDTAYFEQFLAILEGDQKVGHSYKYLNDIISKLFD